MDGCSCNGVWELICGELLLVVRHVGPSLGTYSSGNNTYISRILG